MFPKQTRRAYLFFFGASVIIISIFQNLGGAILNLSHREERRAGGKEKQWEEPHAHHLSLPHTQPQGGYVLVLILQMRKQSLGDDAKRPVMKLRRRDLKTSCWQRPTQHNTVKQFSCN